MKGNGRRTPKPGLEFTSQKMETNTKESFCITKSMDEEFTLFIMETPMKATSKKTLWREMG